MNSAPKHWAVLLACVVIVTFMVILVRNDTGKAYARTSWEYKVLDTTLDERDLNQLGVEGWELVMLVRTDQSLKRGGAWMFKRPK
jgi:hypothetical protein